MAETLFLTKVALDSRQRSVRSAVAEPRDLHRCLMKAFPENLDGPGRSAAGLLYRLEPSGHTILAQSRIKPEPDRLPNGFAARTIDITKVLDRLARGLTVRYECVATPVRRQAKTKKEVALKGEAAEQWWTERAQVSGLELPTNSDGNRVVLTEDRSLTIRGWRTLGYTRFEGVATIVDSNQLRAAVQRGIGRNKNWGAGLLTMTPAQRT